VPNEIKRFLNPKILANGWVKLLEKMKLCKKEKQKGIFAYEFWIECHGLKWRIYKRARDFDILEKSVKSPNNLTVNARNPNEVFFRYN